MDSHVTLTAAHWLYLIGVISIIVTMIFRANVLVPSIAATFLVVLAWTGNPVDAIGGIFGASLVAAKELFNIFLVIALMTALLNSLKDLKSDILMVKPFRLFMTNGTVSYLLLAVITYLISLFFWPTPAIPLVCAVLLPAAIAAGLPPMIGAAAVAIAGQGMALSSDYVIGVAPGISAKASGALASVIADRALVLSLITGVIALVLVFVFHRKTFLKPSPVLLTRWQAIGQSGSTEFDTEGTAHKIEIARGTSHEEELATGQDIQRELSHIEKGQRKWSRVFAILTPIIFLAIVVLMALPKLGVHFQDLKGGAAASLVGGAAAMLMIFAALAFHGTRSFLDASANHITEGFVFAFRAMGSVLPIAGFFFLGASETAAAILGTPVAQTPSILFELVSGAQDWIPHSKVFVAFGVLIVGMITGIDGSGFSGLPLTGALSGALGPVSGMQPATLAAVGQMGAIWTGGGTLIAWSSLIAVAGFARVNVLELVRVLTPPVLIGLATATLAAVALF